MGQFLNLRGEKTSETAFYQALCQALQTSDVKLVDYCCAESVMVDENNNGNFHLITVLKSPVQLDTICLNVQKNLA